MKHRNCCMSDKEREREREKGLLGFTPYLQIYTRLRYISRKPCFFVLLSQEIDTEQPYSLRDAGLHQASPINRITADWLLSLLTDHRLLGVENFRPYIFWTPTHSSNAIHIAFLLFLVYLKTQLHILFWTPKLTGRSKVNM